MKLVLATNNSGKVEQFKILLKDLEGVSQVVTLKELGILDDIAETGTTYQENSIIKAHTARLATNQICLAEDGGIEIDALPNKLGVYTARYHKELNKIQKLQHVLDLLKDVPDEKRTARFTAVITCEFPNGDRIQTKHVLEGTITKQMKQPDQGMSYAVIFQPKGSNKNLSEYNTQELVKINHRGLATQKFIAEWNNYLKTHDMSQQNT